MVALTVVLYAGALLFMAFAIRARMRPRKLVYAIADDAARSRRGLLGRTAAVLWLSGMLFLFEPAYAIVNIALNLLWDLVWIPRRLRVAGYEITIEIAAAPERVFRFMTDLGNWPRYRDDVELVEVIPPGPLAEGSEYVARVPLSRDLKRIFKYAQAESRYRVTSMTPGRSYTVCLADGRGETSTLIEASDGGSRLTRRYRLAFPFAQAALGALINERRAIPSQRDSEAKRVARVKQILETPSQ